MRLLDNINSPEDLRKLAETQLPEFCDELRNFLIDTASDVGGHFASNLGVVELTVALHYVFESPKDKLLWDVGHQIYPHKVLTGRKDKMQTIRKKDGLSGFPKRDESEHDLYNVGHAGTSISQLLGEVVARDVKGEDSKCIAIIGDASISSGMAFEALNHGGFMNRDALVILNDNDHSISPNTGALNKYLIKLIANKSYNRWKKWMYHFIRFIPVIGIFWERLIRKTESGLKHALMPTNIFEELGFRYFGPVDGHNVLELVALLRKLKELNGPIIVHTITQKGKGYHPAEKDPIKYHGVTPFNRQDGSFHKKPPEQPEITNSAIVGEVLSELAHKDDKVVVTTPAMIEGSGLKKLQGRFPDKVFDVGIAEQHATTFAGSMSAAGLKSFLCIYSTFLQRGFDQLIHDVALMNFPLKMIIDRAGAVGNDGETHQGLIDIALFLACPNVEVIAPRDGRMLVNALYTMYHDDSAPMAVRFPKAAVAVETLPTDESLQVNFKDGSRSLGFKPTLLQKAKAEVLRRGGGLVLLATGPLVSIALEVADILEKKYSQGVTVIDPIWLRPLDIETITRELQNVHSFYLIEDASDNGGILGYLLKELGPGPAGKFARAFHFPDEPIDHAARNEQLELYGIEAKNIAAVIASENKNSFSSAG